MNIKLIITAGAVAVAFSALLTYMIIVATSVTISDDFLGMWVSGFVIVGALTAGFIAGFIASFFQEVK